MTDPSLPTDPTPEQLLQHHIDAIARLRPDLVVLPRIPTHIMCLRGLQGGSVFLNDPFDVVEDYIEFLPTMPHVKGVYEGTDPFDSYDDRKYFVMSAIYRGCIEGFEEWERYGQQLATDKERRHHATWLKPCIPPPEEDLSWDKSE